MPSKPMQRSLDHLRKTGWTVANVEKWIPPRGAMKFGVRQDVWGFGDILACRFISVPKHHTSICASNCGDSRICQCGHCASGHHPGSLACSACGCKRWAPAANLQGRFRQTALVQTFPAARWKDHIEKIASIPEAKAWKAAGNFIILMAWSKMAVRDAEGKLKKGKSGRSIKHWTLREEWI